LSGAYDAWRAPPRWAAGVDLIKKTLTKNDLLSKVEGVIISDVYAQNSMISK